TLRYCGNSVASDLPIPVPSAANAYRLIATALENSTTLFRARAQLSVARFARRERADPACFPSYTPKPSPLKLPYILFLLGRRVGCSRIYRVFVSVISFVYKKRGFTKSPLLRWQIDEL
ncbi:unnamed protein product, partial [Ixodes pacificus]